MLLIIFTFEFQRTQAAPISDQSTETMQNTNQKDEQPSSYVLRYHGSAPKMAQKGPKKPPRWIFADDYYEVVRNMTEQHGLFGSNAMKSARGHGKTATFLNDKPENFSQSQKLDLTSHDDHTSSYQSKGQQKMVDRKVLFVDDRPKLNIADDDDVDADYGEYDEHNAAICTKICDLNGQTLNDVLPFVKFQEKLICRCGMELEQDIDISNDDQADQRHKIVKRIPSSDSKTFSAAANNDAAHMKQTKSI